MEPLVPIKIAKQVIIEWEEIKMKRMYEKVMRTRSQLVECGKDVERQAENLRSGKEGRYRN